MKILFVTLEQSGIQNLKSILDKDYFKRNSPNIYTFGLNKNYLNYKDLTNLNVKSLMGLTHILLNIKYLFKLRREIYEITLQYNFSHIFFIDSFDFTKFYLQKYKIKNILYCQVIGPSVFLWNKKKATYINKNLSKIFSIFEIEKKFYSKNVYSHIGYPLLEKLKLKKKKSNLIKNIGIFLGSRDQEISNNIDEIKKLVNILTNNHDCKIKFFTTLQSNKKNKNIFKNKDINFILNNDKYYNELSKLDFAFACSGTVHLELFYSNIPHIIFYKTNYFNFLFVKIFIKIKYVSIMNIFNDKEIVKEFIQYNFKSNHMYNFFLDLYENKDKFYQYSSCMLKNEYRKSIKKPNYLPIIDYLKKFS